jgi:hypothetical protein
MEKEKEEDITEKGKSCIKRERVLEVHEKAVIFVGPMYLNVLFSNPPFINVHVPTV